MLHMSVHVVHTSHLVDSGHIVLSHGSLERVPHVIWDLGHVCYDVCAVARDPNVVVSI